MTITSVGPHDGRPVLYFHGAASEADDGPAGQLCAALNIRLLRYRRPGYDDSPSRAELSLVEIAQLALFEVAALGIDDLGVIGWSGGGPYALAAAYVDPKRVRQVAVISSWAPMNPPHSGLALGVRLFMRIARRFPRPVLASALAATGRRTPGHVDDIRRVARDWTFTPDAVASKTAVAVWYAAHDGQVPVAPWTLVGALSVHVSQGASWHEPPDAVWTEALNWLVAT